MEDENMEDMEEDIIEDWKRMALEILKDMTYEDFQKLIFCKSEKEINEACEAYVKEKLKG